MLYGFVLLGVPQVLKGLAVHLPDWGALAVDLDEPTRC